MKNKEKNEKTDYKSIAKTPLPLSQETYETLGVALQKGHLKWIDLSAPLRYAFGDFESDKRRKARLKRIEEGKQQDWD